MTIVNMVGGGEEIINNFPVGYQWDVSNLSDLEGVSPVTVNHYSAWESISTQFVYIGPREYIKFDLSSTTLTHFDKGVSNSYILPYTPIGRGSSYSGSTAVYYITYRANCCAVKTDRGIEIGYAATGDKYIVGLIKDNTLSYIEINPSKSDSVTSGAYDGEKWYVGEYSGSTLYVSSISIDFDSQTYTTSQLVEDGIATGVSNPHILGCYGNTILVRYGSGGSTIGIKKYTISTNTITNLLGTSTSSYKNGYIYPGFGLQGVGSTTAAFSTSDAITKLYPLMHDPDVFSIDGCQTVYGLDAGAGNNSSTPHDIYIYGNNNIFKQISLTRSGAIVTNIYFTSEYPGDGVIVNGVYSPNTIVG